MMPWTWKDAILDVNSLTFDDVFLLQIYFMHPVDTTSYFCFIIRHPWWLENAFYDIVFT